MYIATSTKRVVDLYNRKIWVNKAILSLSGAGVFPCFFLLNYPNVGKHIPYPGSPVGPNKVASQLEWMIQYEGFPTKGQSLVFRLPGVFIDFLGKCCTFHFHIDRRIGGKISGK